MHPDHLAQAHADWSKLLPSQDHQRQVATIITDLIVQAQAISPTCWMISFNHESAYFNVNIGALFAMSVTPKGLSVLLDRSTLAPGLLPAHWSGAKYDRTFKIVEGATWACGPVAEVLGLWGQLKPSFEAAVGKVLARGGTPPWWRAHAPVAVQLLRDITGRDLPDAGHQVVPASPVETLEDLVLEFVDDYPGSPAGRDHVAGNIEAETSFRAAFADLRARRRAGQDITADVLTRLLPHSRNKGNLERGAWICMAPALRTDVRMFLEAGHKAKPEDWPVVASLLMDLFETCADHPAQLAQACQAFIERTPAKGIQAGMLSPGLCMVNPDAFAVVNAKPLEVVRRFAGHDYTGKLSDYPAANAAVLELAARVGNLLEGVPQLEPIHPTLRFDMFTHWLVVVRQPNGRRYWKVAPGEKAFNWDNCRNGGFISMGWEKFGDLSLLTKDEFNELSELLAAQDDEYSPGGTPQLWTFAHNIRRGDMILANKGLTQVLGVGRVTGPYRYEPDVVHGHQLPVEWLDYAPKTVEKQGWYKTVVEMSRDKFAELTGVNLEDDMEPQAAPGWIFQANPKLFNLAHELAMSGEDAIDAWKVSKYVDAIKDGDTVLLWQAGKGAAIHAVAEVCGDVFEVTPETADEFVEAGGYKAPLHIRRVLERPVTRVLLQQTAGLEELHILKAPFGTNFRVTALEMKIIQRLIDELNPPPPPPVDIVKVAEEIGFAVAELQRWLTAIERKCQAVLYGPPGTGKTFVAERLAQLLVGANGGFVELVQFHPAYAYEDFIQGLRPVATAGGRLDYQVLPGRFLQFCQKAQGRKGTCVLIIDEINRANLARVFGELMYLLEYRGRSVPLAGGGALSIPENVRIVGTMNTADRSIALVDHALRRRFAFIHLRPQMDVLRRYHQKRGRDVTGLVEVLQLANEKINDPHYHIGISFFMREDLPAHIDDIWRMEIEPYLEEYFFDRPAVARELSWDAVKARLA